MEKKLTLARAMEARGMDRFAAGFFASVHNGKGPSVVVKRFDHTDACLHWLRLARLMQDNPHVPRIYALVERKHMMACTAVIERLRPIVEDEWRCDALKIAARDARLRDWLIVGRGRPSANEYRPSCPTLTPAWCAAMNAAVSLAQEFRLSMDCHLGNVMLRADGTPVITDPVY